MKELYEIAGDAQRLELKMSSLCGCLDLPKIEEEIKNLEEETANPSFWSDPKNAAKINGKLSNLNDKKNTYEGLFNRLEDIKAALSLLKEEDDKDLHNQTEKDVASLSKDMDAFETELYLSGAYDHMNAILEFHPGAGGTEAHDWAGMLFRMYTKYCDSHGFKYKVLDYQEGEEAGISSATLEVMGKNAYGLLKSERGVHRMVRLSPFDAAHSRHTSFASVNVMPELDDSVDVEINPAEITIETYRSSGAGGQNVNKTESAIRIIHHPTGIVVTCQVERSQMQNKALAMNLLKSRLFQLREKERQEKLNKINGVKKDIEWGSQIRSYVFQPYTMVKDHRTEYSVGDIQKVMDGNLDGFIDAYLKWKYKEGRTDAEGE
ncbi:MAG: peptide chain release factor 2 [Clostridium sp.]|nr:peptide chain release factor 2 [Clostridium sp.]